VRRWVSDGPARAFDRGGGVVLGALGGLALAWLLAAVVIFQPGTGDLGLREDVRESRILSTALRLVPPDDVLGALARADAFPIIPLPAGALPEPDPSVTRSAGARAARQSVVQLSGRACGLITQGSGWVAGDDLVVTNAHVIAGEDDTRVTVAGGPSLSAQPVYVDATNDVAVLRVDGLDLPALAVGAAPRGAEPVTLLGYPGGGPLTARAGTASSPRTTVTSDAYGNGGTVRSIIVTRGTLGPGSSGGPIVDADGDVVAMIFGGSDDGVSGAAVPPKAIRAALGARLAPVSSGPCR
jgi:S1-C subfamily serine protease